MYDIVHITTVHPRDDVRIALKELHTLSNVNEWKCGLIVADGKGTIDSRTGRYMVVDVGKTQGSVVVVPVGGAGA